MTVSSLLLITANGRGKELQKVLSAAAKQVVAQGASK